MVSCAFLGSTRFIRLAEETAVVNPTRNSAELLLHPNEDRWRRARASAVERGRLVVDIVNRERNLCQALVLDLGSGYGGTSAAMLEAGATVTSTDHDKSRLLKEGWYGKMVSVVCATADNLPYAKSSFDIVILQDVIEHLQNPSQVLSEIFHVLSPEGILYISTPNRFAPLNCIADPHWGLPFASVLRRPSLRRYLSRFRPSDATRPDLAQLFSFQQLKSLLATAGFACEFRNSIALRALFLQPERVVWSDFHLMLVSIMRRFHLHGLAGSIITDRDNFRNRYLTPTWYLICRKLQ
jgi:SAM-dependent methyltransferase